MVKTRETMLYLLVLILFGIISYLIAFKNCSISIHDVSLNMDNSQHQYKNLQTILLNSNKTKNKQHIPFTKMLPQHQTKLLHEMFKFEMNKFLIDKLKTNQANSDSKIITAANTFSIINKLYNSMNNSIINFIQIGACNADLNAKGYRDKFQEIIINNNNYNGVMVEPVPHLFNGLITNMNKYMNNNTQRILFMNAAFNSINGMQTFYAVNNDKMIEDNLTSDKNLLNQVGSFSK
eukprot:178250_1